MNNILDVVDFTGKTAIVTGGTMGLGEGIADAFLAAGADVVICARNKERGEAKAKELSEKHQRNCVFIPCDVNNEDDIKHVIETAVQKFGRLDALVNNAGFHPGEEYIDDLTGDDFRSLLNLNLVSYFLFCKYALPYLRKTGGAIVNMASLVGSMGQAKACRYISTKGGILGLTKALAVDEGMRRTGVRVNSVSPGSIMTPLTEEYFKSMDDPEGAYKRQCDATVMGRLGTLDECGSVCLFLASDMAGYLTGVDIPISGGAELSYGAKIE